MGIILVAQLPWGITLHAMGFLIPFFVINALFVIAEFSVVALRRSRVHQLVDDGSSRAIVVQRLQRQIDRFLSVTQVGITLASVALGWVGKDGLTDAISHWLIVLEVNEEWKFILAPIVTFCIIIYLQIVLGELVPKSIGLLYSEQLALVLARPSEIMMEVMSPLLWLLSQSTQLLLRLIGVEYSLKSWYSAVSAEELHKIIATSTESSGLEAEERELLKNVFEFSEITTAEVMVPRTSIAYLEVTATITNLFAMVESTSHLRYPVTGESLDDIRGIVSLKEVVSKLAKNNFQLDQPIAPFIRPVRFVSEDIYLGELLPQMQRSQQSIVMVVDEYGGTAGLVTMEDIMSEIVNTRNDPPSQSTPKIRTLDERNFLVQAQVSLEEVNESLDLEIPVREDYQTLGGFVMYHLQKIPVQGERFVLGDLEITIAATDGPRIDRVRICRLEDTEVSEEKPEP